MTLGNIHSIESCGTVDGPGIRFVVFTQGCPLRCQYCHNPDTWDLTGEGNKMSVDEILTQYEGVGKDYFDWRRTAFADGVCYRVV